MGEAESKTRQNSFNNLAYEKNSSVDNFAFMQRYQEIIPDWDSCLQALQQPLPMCCWANTLKVTGDRLYELLSQDHFNPLRLNWNKDAFQIDLATDSKNLLGRSWLYLSGLLQIQEQVAMLAGKLLDAQPGETVLDMCAAPGNKSAQIALAMQNKGTLIANDRDYQRLRALGQITKRLGIMNLCATNYDGALFPGAANTFDRILVDAPCSCLGTSRKKQRPMVYKEIHAARLAGVQRALLRRAIYLAKPGARIVYATCTYAPEENEAIVDWALRVFADQLEIIAVDINPFRYSAGITNWQGKSYLPEVSKSIRIWPHQNNSGGFFIAVLRKKSKSITTSIVKKPIEKQETLNKKADCLMSQQKYSSFIDIPDTLRECFVRRFGFDEALFKQYNYHSSSRGWYMVPDDFRVPKQVKHDSSGLFLIKKKSRFPKLTTTSAMLLGIHASDNYLNLDLQQVKHYVRGETIFLHQEQLAKATSGGYVLVRYQELTLGVGQLCLSAIGADKSAGSNSARLLSLFPRSWQGGG